MNNIEFISDIHTYLSDGVIIPSVSQLVNIAVPKDFSQIPEKILKQAQEYGSQLHEAIYKVLTNGEITRFDDIRLKYGLEEFLRLKDRYIQDNPSIEMIVDYQGRYAGRYDCFSNGVLIDYKTNYKPDIDSLEYQMGFYKLANESHGIEVKKCVCLWLPKGKAGQWIDITPRTEKECIEVLESYEDNRRSKRPIIRY